MAAIGSQKEGRLVCIEKMLPRAVVADSEVQHAAAVFNLLVNDLSLFAVGAADVDAARLCDRVQVAAIRLNHVVLNRKKELLIDEGRRELRG
jgi:hypothetical protein